MNHYHTTHRAKCPNGKLADHYQITVSSRHMIQVEAIQAALNELPPEIYQEGIADALRATLGASVKVSGWHYNFLIECVRE